MFFFMSAARFYEQFTVYVRETQHLRTRENGAINSSSAYPIIRYKNVRFRHIWAATYVPSRGQLTTEAQQKFAGSMPWFRHMKKKLRMKLFLSARPKTLYFCECSLLHFPKTLKFKLRTVFFSFFCENWHCSDVQINDQLTGKFQSFWSCSNIHVTVVSSLEFFFLWWIA